MHKKFFFAFLFVSAFLLTARAADSSTDAKKLEIRQGDRVVLLGDTFIEREPSYGYIETRLVAHFPDINFTVRNLGWSADTVLGESRASFDPPEKGFERLKEHLASIKPTVVILGYGMAASFDGEAALPKFRADMLKLLGTIKEVSKGQDVRFMIVGPILHEAVNPRLPDGREHNSVLLKYSEALKEIASAEKCPFVALISELRGGGQQFTDNGIHLSNYGYFRAGQVIERHLAGETRNWKTTDMPSPAGTRNFTGLHQVLPLACPPKINGERSFDDQGATLKFDLPAPGKHTLKVDGKPAAVHTAAEWAAGQKIDTGADYEQAEELRQAIIKKNQLYFYRWRPQNETYLFGFRKHEQGQNSREIPMFDPLITEQEQKIAELKKPRPHKYELVKHQEGDEKQIKSVVSSRLPPVQQSKIVPQKEQPLPEFEMSPELEVTLFAENPDLAKPIQMNFDPQGRLWVASSSVYPQIQPGQTANDKIIILEDTNHDGKADKSTVFADGLLIPTGVEPGNGGAYVANSTELLFYKDLDGDGIADQKQVVLSGFGTEDTHHILHTLRWGHDGQLYFNQSIYIHSHLETPHGVVRLNSGGIFHFRTDTMELGIHMRGLVNTWGHHFDRYGQSFATDGAGNEGINYVVPGAMYFTYAGARRILGSASPGNYPKFASLETLESEHFPPEWQGNLITCDFRAHRVVRFAINDQNSGFVTKEMPDVMRTTNVTFRPIDVKLGPDGALYIADWSNPIIQHGEVDFRDPRRDHENGRIWRVTAKGRPLLKPIDYVKASTPSLLDNLTSPNNYVRQRSRRVLFERTPSIKSDLDAWSKKQTADLPLLEALWMYQGLDVVEPGLLDKVLHSKDGRILAAGVRAISYWHKRLPNALALLTPLVQDDYARVRLESVRALAELNSAEAASVVLSVAEKPMDRFLEYAVWLSINDLATPWINAIQSGAWKMEGHDKQLAYGLTAIRPDLASGVLAKLLSAGPIPRDGSGPWLDLIGKAGGPAELRLALDQLSKSGFDDAGTAKAADALADAARLRNQRPSGDLSSIATLLQSPATGVKVSAAKLAGAWKFKGAIPALLVFAGDKQSTPEVRDAAMQSLREIGGNEASAGLKKLAAKGEDLPTRQKAAQALAGMDLGASLPVALEVLSDTSDEQQALALWRSLLNIKGAAAQLAAALPKSGLPSVVAKTGLRAAREGGRNDPNLVIALARNIDAEDEAKNLTPAELKQLVTDVSAKGDPARGEMIYRRTELGCVGCHSIGGVGGKVGPDMTSIGASAQIDYLIESVQFPNRKVKEGFHSLLVETKDGQEFSGILVRETSDQLILRDASNKDVSVAKNNVQKQTISGSIMPAGLVDALSTAEQTDLYRFLSELGKPGPYDASKGNVARIWRLHAMTVDTAQFGDEGVLAKPLTNADWVPSSALVDGRLLKPEFEGRINAVRYRNPDGVYAAVQFEAAKAGPVRFEIENGGSAPVWIDGRPARRENGIIADVTTGTHTLVVRLEAKKLPEFLRVKTNDGTFLTN